MKTNQITLGLLSNLKMSEIPHKILQKASDVSGNLFQRNHIIFHNNNNNNLYLFLNNN